MRDLDYLNLLSKNFSNREKVLVEIANLNAILSLPKTTEYFLSDLHGEHLSFIHLLHSAFGVIRKKLKLIFDGKLNDEEILKLANLIYYPEEKVNDNNYYDFTTFEIQKDIIQKLIILVKSISDKYTRSKVRKAIKNDYVYIIEELLYKDVDINKKKDEYYNQIIKSMFDTGLSKKFIIELCKLIQKLAVDQLHIVGDIFDRGPRHDMILDELIKFNNVDIQWGNHDINWIGAFLGNEALICNCLRIAIRYNCFDMLEDGYGINLRKLSEFAAKTYKDEDSKIFPTSILDENIYDIVDPVLSSKMQKALAVMQFKLSGQLIKKHPEYGMNNRIMLERIDFDRCVVDIDGEEYELIDRTFPTIDKNNPLKLSFEEEELVKSLKYSFMRSNKLKQHIKFVMDNGSVYKICNGNLLYHGVVPLDDNGEFVKFKSFDGKNEYKGKEFFDYINDIIVKAYNDRMNNVESSDNIDAMYYMWCGKDSPFFGRNKISTFEIYFVKDKNIHKEIADPYYTFAHEEKYAIKILKEFGLNEKGHIINGHVPVKRKDGELPIKANGRLFVIDGGLSKAYQKKTGIAGYTLIFDSIHLTLATHKPFEKGKFNTPLTENVEKISDRVYVRDTDIGKELIKQIDDLNDLFLAYKNGLIKEK